LLKLGDALLGQFALLLIQRVKLLGVCGSLSSSGGFGV
tara:strand:+ start:204 stop:317 length:114 start_codon:yes stop_codon:yes gene_type:complete